MSCCKINNHFRSGRICLYAVLLSLFFGGGAFSAARRVQVSAKEYFEIAQAYAETAKYDKAIVFYRKAAEDPEHKNAAEYNLARMYGLKNDWVQAKKILERQYKEAPGNTVVMNAFAYTLAVTGEAERAAALYKALYDADKENPEAAFNYARILIVVKKYTEAAAFIESIAPQFPETAEKRILDELSEKIKKLLEPPKEEASDTEQTSKTAPSQKGTADKKDGAATEPKTAAGGKKNSPNAEQETAGVKTAVPKPADTKPAESGRTGS